MASEDNTPEGDEFANDKNVKKTLLIETITKESTTSDHEILQQINTALNNGSRLEAVVLSGGYTNYSYKVYVKEQPKLCVFAKLSFEYALVRYIVLYFVHMIVQYLFIYQPSLIPYLSSPVES